MEMRVVWRILERERQFCMMAEQSHDMIGGNDTRSIAGDAKIDETEICFLTVELCEEFDAIRATSLREHERHWRIPSQRRTYYQHQFSSHLFKGLQGLKVLWLKLALHEGKGSPFSPVR
jgi:hypothetical protein